MREITIHLRPGSGSKPEEFKFERGELRQEKGFIRIYYGDERNPLEHWFASGSVLRICMGAED